MTITTFKDLVAAYMLRAAGSLVTSGSTDLILLATNNAKKFMQRNHNFEYARVAADLILTNGVGDVEDTTLSGTATPVVTKVIERAYTNNNNLLVPIRILSKSQQSAHLRRRVVQGDVAVGVTSSELLDSETDPFVVQVGQQVFLNPRPTGSTTVALDIVRWMPDYDFAMVGPVSTDFFLDFCSDYLLYRTITELNFFLKEDERVNISQAKAEESWRSVLAWDTSIVEQNTTQVEG